MSKQIKLEIARYNPDMRCWLYSDLQLPAEEPEIRDALQRARITNEDTPFELSIYECQAIPLLPFRRLDTPSIAELNFLAKRLEKLTEDETDVLKAVAPKILAKDEYIIISAKDLINLTYNLDTVTVIPNIHDNRQLGNYVIENKIQGDISAIPEESLYLLDANKLGELQRKNDNGVLMNGKYIKAGEYELPNIYDGEHLPPEKPYTEYAFKLEITLPPEGDDLHKIESKAEWLTLPTERSNADNLAQRLGLSKIEDGVYLDFNSSIPQISADKLGNMHDFDKLNSLAKMMLDMTPSDQVKFKAVLASEEPQTIEKILDIAQNLNQYDFSPLVINDAHFFKSYLLRHLDDKFDPRWLDDIAVRFEGAEMLSLIGGTVTDYGVVSARGGHLYDLIPRYDESEIINEPTEEKEEPDESPKEQELGGN